ncbi:MAG: ribosomal protein [Capsulimonas sp.]|jgi:large subunit ribosomal protein L6|nr:ribosomal protein [Capsulimonas sp.]
MSRIGKAPITIPAGVDVQIATDGGVTVKGPKGTLSRRFQPDMAFVIQDGVLTVQRPTDSKTHRALHGLTRSLVSNMVTGVSTGYKKVLEIEGVGFRATKDGKKLVLSLGFSHLVPVEPLEGIDFEVGQDNATRRPVITINGIDKEVVGQQAAVIRKMKPPEPYKGKGIRYQGEIVRRKAGKSGKAGGKGGGKGKK